MKDVDADYYGYCDDDDGVLIPLEQEAERIGKQFQLDQLCNYDCNFIFLEPSHSKSCCRLAG